MDHFEKSASERDGTNAPNRQQIVLDPDNDIKIDIAPLFKFLLQRSEFENSAPSITSLLKDLLTISDDSNWSESMPPEAMKTLSGLTTIQRVILDMTIN